MRMHLLALDIDTGNYRAYCGADSQRPNWTAQQSEVTCERCLRFWARRPKKGKRK